MIDIVTVVFAADLPLLDLQARSFARFLAPTLVDRIRIIVNDPVAEDACVAHVDTVTRGCLGALADRLVIERAPRALAPGPEGWKAQQAGKLAIAQSIAARHYLVLDAKHHLVRPLVKDDLFAGSKVRMPFVRLTRNARRWLADSYAFFGMEFAGGGRPSPPSVPPFMMRTSVACRLVDEIEARSGLSIGDFFATKADDSTEFMLYIAYVRFLGRTRALFSRTSVVQPTMRRRSPTSDAAEAYFAAVAERDPWVLAIHRRRFLDLGEDRATRGQIVAFWVSRGLFDDAAAAEAEMERLVGFYARLRGTPEMMNRVRLVAAAQEREEEDDEAAETFAPADDEDEAP